MEPLDAYGTLTELNFILRIFGLHNIYRKNNLTAVNLPYKKISCLLLFFGVMLSYNIYYHYCSELLFPINLTVKIMDTLSIILGYLYYLIDLYFMHKYAGESYIAYIEIYGEIDKYFEMTYHRDVRRQVKRSVIMFSVLWFVSSVSDYAAWCSCFEWQSPTSYMVVYFTFLIRVLTVLELSSHSMLVGYRLKTIADTLKDHFAVNADMPSRIKVVRKSQVLIKNKAKIVPVKIREVGEVARLASYYLLLSRQATFLNNFFGVRILLHCLYTLSELISFVNMMDRILVGSMVTSSGGLDKYTRYHIGYYPAVTTFLRLLTCTALLTSLVYRCEQSSRQSGHVIDSLDHLLVNKKLSLETQASLQLLRGLVSTRPIRFHAANFFNLDSTLLLSTASVVATYAVLLIQSN